MNPRQRRGVLFILLSAVLAVVVFFVVVSYVANVASRVGSLVTVYRAAGPVAAYAPLDENSIVADEVPARWLADVDRLTEDDLIGRSVAVNLEEGTMLTADMLVPASDLSPTEREIAVNVDSVTGLAGRIETGDYVDIYAVFADVPGLPKQVRVLVRNVRIVSVRGEQTTVDEDATTGQQTVIPVTLALEPNDALSVTYASAFAAEVRLVGLPTGTGEDRTGEQGEFDAEDLGGQAIPEGGN
ncbi:Flp pilus assembly protein CpaB [Pengzhenrongella sicca]|uniref:Flp pilus assembly protein CpaB n=1 Tax=Pengzhenrongella sicca TaxID=2819238 RepID=A0A8A4ZD94_9MICO|nr:Flp pilus assembly protein CpaB [Pengzhenrongella sicca]QTE29950.1 Flp pilus assembly protein CpaB [Pengzhenrongella sicca]